jgi:hypothetical protein
MIARRCTVAGCGVLTIGSRCVEHDEPVTRAFERGRPYRPSAGSPAGGWTPALALPLPAAATVEVARGRRLVTAP